MQNQQADGISRSLLTVILVLASSWTVAAAGSDPLDERDGTEGWDQVVETETKSKTNLQAEHDAFRREVTDWETVRDLWQVVRTDYLAERGRHKKQSRELNISRRPAPEADITEHNLYQDEDWEDSTSSAWFDSTGSKAIADELGEAGSTVDPDYPTSDIGRSPTPLPASRLQPGNRTEKIPSAFSQPAGEHAEDELRREHEDRARREAMRKALEEKARKEAMRRSQEEKARQEAMRKAAEEETRRKVAEQEAKRRADEEKARRQAEIDRRRHEAEGAEAAARLLRQQEEQMKLEQKALRDKARLKVDEDGQMVDPELAREIEEDEENEEEAD